MSPPFNNTHVTNAWAQCNNTRPGDPSTGSCNKTNVTSADWRVCEALCAHDPRCYSWAWAANNLECYSRSDCYWPPTVGTVPGRVSGYKGAAPPAPRQTTRVAVPTPEQLEWMDFEVGAMLGFNLQTICVPKAHPNATTQRCQASSATQGALFVPNRGHIAAWNPAALDTDAWVATAASFGAKYVVLVADHMTGFTLWDTAAHDYSIAHTAYKGGGQDVVRDFVASCAKHGVRPGYFYSMHFNWFLGVDGFEVGHPPLGPRSYTQQEYLAIAEAQLREIFSNSSFGEAPAELWFDGGTGPSNATAARIVREVAPRAMCHSCEPFTQDPADPRRGYGVRWMGNEYGRMPLPSWGASTGGQHGGGTAGGSPLGATFQPPSCDAVLREHYWFWQPGTEGALKSTKTLVGNYLTSVGRAANLILNVAPDATGAVPAADVARYTEMGEAIKCLFSSRVASGGAQNASAADGTIVWSFGEEAAIASRNLSVVLLEDQTDGQLIGKWSLDCQERGSGDWSACHAHDEGIGHKRIVNILRDQGSSDITAMRLNVLQHYALPDQTPRMRALEVYDWESKAGCV
jgi:alpha-L-fucosidase